MNHSLLELLAEGERKAGKSRIFGAVIGIVTNNNGDPDGLNRVRVQFPWLSAADESFWARIAAPMAGNGRGAYFLPEVGDEVLVVFEHGDVRFPYVVGSLWNGKDKPPADNADGDNNVRIIKSRSGHVIKLNDEKGKETIEIVAAGGKNSIVIDTANKRITIISEQDIVLSAPDGTLKLEAKKIEATTTETTKLEAVGALDVTTSDTLTLQGKTVNIN